MVTTNLLPPPPIRQPIMIRDGQMNQAWITWFTQLFQRVGGAISYSGADVDVLQAYSDITVSATPAGSLSGDTLPSNIIYSSLQTVGTLTSGVWNASVIGVTYGGTGASSASGARTNLGLVIGTNVFTQRTFTGTANEIAITNGDGTGGNPTFSLPSSLTFTGKTVTGGTFTDFSGNGTYLISTTTNPYSVITTTGTITLQTLTTGDIALDAAGDVTLDGATMTISSDADVILNPIGVVQFGTHSAIGAETLTGYITIKDSGGNSRKLAVVS